jgi:AcrR family transcriptional regulator
MSSQKRPYELKARAQRQEETRRRIVDATVALHEEVGPARTTVAEIARRAGVTRLTVYNHFPEDAELFAACQGEFMSRHPLPDLAPAFALEDPCDRVRAVLGGLYAGYRAREPMTRKVLRDRSAIPALDELMARTADVQMAGLADALAGGFGIEDGPRATRLRAVAALALDFWTWSRLTAEGLDDAEAAELMAGLVEAARG